MQQQKRINWIDIAKGIGIILVVIGHTPVDFGMGKIIYQFHMPLFFFLSGILYYNKFDTQPKSFIFSRLKGLYFPYIKYCIILVIAYTIFYFFLTGELVYSRWRMILFQFLIGYNRPHWGGALWFLTSLLIVSAIFILIRIIYNKVKIKNDFAMLVPVLFVFIIGYNTQLPCKISTSFVALFFYFCGYLYSKKQEKISFSRFPLIISFILLIIFSFFNEVNMAGNTYTHWILLFISSFAGIYFTIGISKFISKNQIIEYVGRNTLPIIAYHFASFVIINYIIILVYNLSFDRINDYPTIKGYPFWWILYSIIGIFIPLLINKISFRIKSYFCLI